MPDTTPTLADKLAQVISSVKTVRAKYDTCLLCGKKPPTGLLDQCSLITGAGYVCPTCHTRRSTNTFIR